MREPHNYYFYCVGLLYIYNFKVITYVRVSLNSNGNGGDLIT